MPRPVGAPAPGVGVDVGSANVGTSERGYDALSCADVVRVVGAAARTLAGCENAT